jgi:hypothetical protein
VDAISALKMVCEAASLSAEEQEGKLVIARSPFLQFNGGKAPVIGAVPASMWFGHGAAVDSTPASFEGDGKLVDLEVKDAPLREAMEKISKASGVAIEVDETVSKEIKVSATIRKLPLREVLSLLVNQANLTYTVENNPNRDSFEDLANRAKAGLIPRSEFERELRNLPQVATIHIVPKPELKVTGAPGAPGAFGVFDLQGLAGGQPGGFNAEALKEQLKALPGGGAEATKRFERLYADALKQYQTPGSITRIACSKCHKSFVRIPASAYCPYCGAKLPAEKPKVDGE